MDTSSHSVDEQEFFNQAAEEFSKKAPDLSQTLNIAVLGKVSSGKSSLINALLRLSRKQGLENARVGAVSGVTKDIKILQLDEKVCLIDSPGLDDVRAENSEVTRKFLKNIDVGIFVVTGSSDASQKKILDDLRRHCGDYFVVLNKIDEWDDLDKSVLEEVIQQWKHDLGVQKIYPTCTKGYDPKSRLPFMDIRGVASLRSDIEAFLKKKKKDLLFARHMGNKQPYAIGIIAVALMAVAAEAFIPGSSAYITATQAAAIASLNYLYTGEVLSPITALQILPVFIAETAGQSLFLFAKSFLPPTGFIDLIAAGVAVSVTLALLATVNYVLSQQGGTLDQKDLLRTGFKKYRKSAEETVKNLSIKEIQGVDGWTEIVQRFLRGQD